jgi:hypothetical protein
LRFLRKILFTVLFIIAAYQSGFSQWISQLSGTYTELHDVYFIDANTGYVVGGLEKF